MLCVNNHPEEYVDQCRSRVAEQVSAYQAMVAAARKEAAHTARLDSAIAAFEPHSITTLGLALDGYFVPRVRGKELNDGNALNELKMLCNSMLNSNHILAADETNTCDPARSVLKYRVGDEIKLSEAGFLLLSTAFNAEIEMKYLRE